MYFKLFFCKSYIANTKFPSCLLRVTNAIKQAKHLLGQTAALMSVFSPLPSCSSTGPERPPVGRLQPFDQVLGEALRRSWQLGLADMAEQMLRMGGAGATLDLRGTRHPIWTSSPGGGAGKEWEQQELSQIFLGWSADLWEFAVF